MNESTADLAPAPPASPAVAPRESAVDPYRGVPPGVEAAWWPTTVAFRSLRNPALSLVCLRALSLLFALARGRKGCRWFRGWAEARMGKPLEAYRRIREAYEDNA